MKFYTDKIRLYARTCLLEIFFPHTKTAECLPGVPVKWDLSQEFLMSFLTH